MLLHSLGGGDDAGVSDARTVVVLPIVRREDLQSAVVSRQSTVGSRQSAVGRGCRVGLSGCRMGVGGRWHGTPHPHPNPTAPPPYCGLRRGRPYYRGVRSVRSVRGAARHLGGTVSAGRGRGGTVAPPGNRELQCGSQQGGGPRQAWSQRRGRIRSRHALSRR